jgi:ribosomal protein S18 acetylase RimI-like enzyme
LAYRNILNISLSELNNIPHPCKSCEYWEVSAAPIKNNQQEGVSFYKEEWYSSYLLSWGSCGKIMKRDGNAVGYAQFGLPAFFKGLTLYRNSKHLDSSALFISCLYIVDEYRGLGLGKELLRSVISEVSKKRIWSIETIARRDSSENPSGPLEFYLANGFYIKKDDFEYPIVRLETRSVLRVTEKVKKILREIELTAPTRAPVIRNI